MKKSLVVVILMSFFMVQTYAQKSPQVNSFEFLVHFLNAHNGSSVKVSANLDENFLAYGLDSNHNLVSVSSFSDQITERYGADLGWDSPVSQSLEGVYIPWGVVNFTVDFHNTHTMQFRIDFRDMKWTANSFDYNDTYLYVDSSSNSCWLHATGKSDFSLYNNGDFAIWGYWGTVPLPETPTNLQITNTAWGPIHLSWDMNVSPVYCYEVSRRVTNGDNTWHFISNASSNSYADNDYIWFPSGGNFNLNYRVRAKDAFNGYSEDYSNTATCTADETDYRVKEEGEFVSTRIPPKYVLNANHPNPFNPSTQFRYELPKAAHVSLKLYDLLGREVATLVDEIREAGYHNAEVDGSNLASGVYVVRFVAKPSDGGTSIVQIRKIVLMK